MGPADFLILLATGAAAGLLAGFLGVGGGAIITPPAMVLYPLLGVPGEYLIPVIFGTNMFLVTLFSLSAVVTHYRNLNITLRTVILMGPPAMLGSVAGGWLATQVQPEILKILFAVFLLFSSLLILRGSPAETAGVKPHWKIPEAYLPVLGLITGLLGSMLGIGGGAIMIMPLILLFKLPVKKVAGTSSSVIIFIGLSGTVSYMIFGLHTITLPGWNTGYVWWSAAIPLMIGGIPMAQVGAWLNNRIRGHLLRRIFGFALFVIALRILWQD